MRAHFSSQVSTLFFSFSFFSFSLMATHSGSAPVDLIMSLHSMPLDVFFFPPASIAATIAALAASCAEVVVDVALTRVDAGLSQGWAAFSASFHDGAFDFFPMGARVQNLSWLATANSSPAEPH